MRNGKRRKIDNAVELHIPFDIRDLRRAGFLRCLPGTELPNAGLRWPGVASVKMGTSAIHVSLQTGRTETIRLKWVNRGFIGRCPTFECPQCRAQTSMLYKSTWAMVCRHCAGLWYACQCTGAKGRQWIRALKLRMKLGQEMPSLAKPFPPCPPRMRTDLYYQCRREAEELERGLERFRHKEVDLRLIVPR